MALVSLSFQPAPGQLLLQQHLVVVVVVVVVMLWLVWFVSQRGPSCIVTIKPASSVQHGRRILTSLRMPVPHVPSHPTSHHLPTLSLHNQDGQGDANAGLVYGV